MSPLAVRHDEEGTTKSRTRPYQREVNGYTNLL